MLAVSGYIFRLLKCACAIRIHAEKWITAFLLGGLVLAFCNPVAAADPFRDYSRLKYVCGVDSL